MPNASSECHNYVLLAGILSILAGCAAPSDRRTIQVEQHEWTSPVNTPGVQLLTEHYDIRTTTQDRVLREYLPTFMEACHAEYRKCMGQPQTVELPADHQPPTANRRATVYVFGRRPEWAAFTARFAPAQAYTYLHIHSGGYMDHPTQTAVLFDIGRDRTLALMAHEGLHQFLARSTPQHIPAWLNEGLATQYEDFDLDGMHPIFRPHRNLLRKNALREALTAESGLLPLSRLLAMNAGQAVTASGDSARTYYAQIWATVLFLRQSKAYGQGFARLLADLGTDRYRANLSAYRAATPAAANLSEGEIVFRQYITEDARGFTNDWKAFARQLVR